MTEIELILNFQKVKKKKEKLAIPFIKIQTNWEQQGSREMLLNFHS